MREITIFGKNSQIIVRKTDRDSARLKNNKILITNCKKTVDTLLNEFLTNLLYSELFKIYTDMKRRRKVEVLGNLDFEIVEKIDRKENRIAKFKGNKILVKLSAIALPKKTLRYIIAHEIAHVFTKKHTDRFWKTVELMCPNFESAEWLLTKYGGSITGGNF